MRYVSFVTVLFRPEAIVSMLLKKMLTDIISISTNTHNNLKSNKCIAKYSVPPPLGSLHYSELLNLHVFLNFFVNMYKNIH